MRKRLIRGITLISLSLVIFSSCSTDIDINAPNQDVPIVYCILNNADSVQYVRVQKTYLVDQAALDNPPVRDSIYFPGEIEITLERWENGQAVEVIPFRETTDYPKDTGFFPHQRHTVYKGFADIKPMQSYYLYVYIKDKETVMFAETTTLGPLNVVDPLDVKQRTISLNLGQNYTTRWKPVDNAGIYQVGLRLNYQETLGDETINRSLDLPQAFTNSMSHIDYQTKEIVGTRFFNMIRDGLQPVEGVVREVTNVDFYFICGGAEINYYIESTSPTDGALLEKPTYTNFINGLGLFSSVSRTEIRELILSTTTLDSLAYGQVTGELGFLDHNGDRDPTNNPK